MVPIKEVGGEMVVMQWRNDTLTLTHPLMGVGMIDKRPHERGFRHHYRLLNVEEKHFFVCLINHGTM